MSLKTQIIALLKKNFSGVQLSKERIESIATKVDAKAEKEEDIEGILNDLNELFPFADMAKQDDRIRSLEDLAKKPATSKTTTEPEKSEAEKKDDDPVLALLKEMKEEITSLKSDKVVSSRKTVAIEKFKDAPEGFRNDLLADLDEISFRDDDHFNSYLERKEKTFADLKQADSDSGLGKDKPLGGVGGGKPGEVKPASKEELDSVMNEIGL